MSAPALTLSEQRRAISGKKKKKKAVKNVLGIPDSLIVECHFVDESEVAKLHEILNRLLPSARLPLLQKDSAEHNDLEYLKMRENAKIRRDQLSLGVNALNKSIKKDSISAVLFADDIQPKFLISHLNLLCDYNKIPFLHMPGLRETTRANLGFPCIAVGFKTNAFDFGEAVENIKSIFLMKKSNLDEKNQKMEISSSESDEAEITDDKTHPQGDEIPFDYLFRNSVKERVFVPETESSSQAKERTEGDFMSIEHDISEKDSPQLSSQVGISSNLIRKHQKIAKKSQKIFTESDSDKDLKVPKKKAKKNWTINDKGTKQNCKYHPAKLFRVPSNPDRKKNLK